MHVNKAVVGPCLHYCCSHLQKVGSQFKRKVQLLAERLSQRREQHGGHFPVLMKGPPNHRGNHGRTGRPVDLLLIDEFQDLTEPQVAVVMEQKASNPDMQTLVVGDIMQTLFDQSIVNGGSGGSAASIDSSDSDASDGADGGSSSSRSSELVVAAAGVLADAPAGSQQASGGLAAMQLWLQQPGVTRFDLDTCWRCPADHVDMVNAVMKGHQVGVHGLVHWCHQCKQDGAGCVSERACQQVC
jgi:hypothetical protein